MAEDLISSIIVKEAIEKELAFLDSALNELATRIKTFPQIRASLENADSFKSLAAGNKDLAAGIDKVTESKNKLAESERKLAILNNAKADNDKATGIKNQSNAYTDLNNKYKEAVRNSQVISAQFGIESAEAKSAALAAAELGTQLKAIRDLPKNAAKSIEREEVALREQELELGRLKILQIKAQQEEEARLLALEEERLAIQKSSKPATGTFDIQQGSGQQASNGIVNTPKPFPAFTPTTDIEKNILQLVQTEAALKGVQGEQKKLQDQLKSGAISQDEFNAKIVKATALELEYKATIAATNAEIKAMSNIDNTIDGSIKNLEARNKALSAQRDVIPVTGGTQQDADEIRTINAEIDKNNDLIRVNKDLLAQQKINIGNYGSSFKGALGVIETELTVIQNKLKGGGLGNKEIDDLVKKQTVLASAQALATKETNSSTQAQNNFRIAAEQVAKVFGKDSDVFKNFTAEVKKGNSIIDENAKVLDKALNTAGKAPNVFQKAFSGLRTIANILPGFGLSGVILLLFAPLEALASAIFKTGVVSSGAKNKIDDLNRIYKETGEAVKQSSAAFEGAVKNVSELTINIDLAKRGFLDKKDVLKEYNETIGLTTGQVKNLDEAEQALVRNGDAYIQMMLLKAAANIALEAAAKKAFDAEVIRRKREEDFAKTAVDTRVNAGGAGGLGTGAFNAAEFDADTKRISEARKKRQQEQIDVQVKAQKEQTDIAKKFQEEAARISKEFGFDFFPDKNNAKTKKAASDQASILDALNKKIIEERSKRGRQELEIEKSNNKDILSDQQSTLAQKLKALENYNIASRALIEKDRQGQKQVADEELKQNLARAKKDLKNADNSNERKVANQERIAALTLRKEQEKTINANAELAISKSIIETENIITTAYDNEFKKRSKLLDDEFKKREENSKRLRQDALDVVDTQTNKQVTDVTENFNEAAANTTLTKRIQFEKLYQQEVEKIQKEAEISKSEIREEELQKELTIARLFGFDTTGIEKQITEEQRKQSELRIGITNKEFDERKKREDETLAAAKQLRDELRDLFETVVFDKPISDLDERLAAIDKEKDRRIAAINETTLAESDKAKRIKAIEKQAAFDTEQIEKRKRQLSIEKARFEKLASISAIIGNTARGVSAALAEFPPNIPLAIIVGALGAVQLAKVIATPIPKFFTGTKNAPKGPATVSERGKELIVTKTGTTYLTPEREAVIGLQGGETIYPAHVTNEIISKVGEPGKNFSEKIASYFTNRKEKNSLKEVRELKLQKEVYKFQIEDETKSVTERLSTVNNYYDVSEKILHKEVFSKTDDYKSASVNDLITDLLSSKETIQTSLSKSTSDTIEKNISSLVSEVVGIVNTILKNYKGDRTAEILKYVNNREVKLLSGAKESRITPIVVSQLPKFFKGTDNAPAGLATVSEYGKELVITKTGLAYLTPHTESIINLHGGEKIYPAHQTREIINTISDRKTVTEKINSLKDLKTLSSIYKSNFYNTSYSANDRLESYEKYFNVNDRLVSMIEKNNSTLQGNVVNYLAGVGSKMLFEKTNVKENSNEKYKEVLKELTILKEVYSNNISDNSQIFVEKINNIQRFYDASERLLIDSEKQSSLVTKGYLSMLISEVLNNYKSEASQSVLKEESHDNINVRQSKILEKESAKKELSNNILQKESVFAARINDLVSDVSDMLTKVFESSKDSIKNNYDLFRFIQNYEVRSITNTAKSNITPLIISKLPAFIKETSSESYLNNSSDKMNKIYISKQGKMYLVPTKETLQQFITNDKVYPAYHSITQSVLSASNISKDVAKMIKYETNKNEVIYDNFFGEKAVDVLKRIEKKSGVIVNNNTAIETTAYYLNNIKR